MNKHADTIIKIVKCCIVLMAANFLFAFFKDSYEELFLNPVHFFEDAYMFIRYAKIWHLGFGESWNIGEGPVYGNTSQLHFLWVLILESFSNLSDDAIIKISSYVPAFIFMGWLPWFCARHSSFFAPHNIWQRSILWIGIICPVVYWNTSFAYHNLTGMDTSLSILLHLLLIDAVLTYGKVSDENKTTYFYIIVTLVYLAFLTRPENILACSLFVLLYLSLILNQLTQAKRFVLILSAVILVDSVFKYIYFGDFLPLAFYSKKAGYIQGNSGAGFSHPAFYFFYFLSTLLPFVVAQLFSLNKDTLIKQAVLVFPAIITLTYFFTMMTVMNMKGRYFYPFLPYFIAAAVVSFGPSTFQLKRYLKNISILGVSLCLFVGLTLADQHRGDIVQALMGDLKLCDDSLKTPADNFAGIGYRVDTDGFDHLTAVLKDMPSDLKIAMTENGYVGAKLPTVNILDMTGLHNLYIARHGFSATWLLEQKPDLIWMPHWHYTCMTHDILYSEAFWQHYRYYPGLLTWGIALRKDGPHYALLNKALDEQTQATYSGYHLSTFEKYRN